MGSRFTIPTLALLAALMAIPAARAADMPLPPPAAEPCCSAWYLRGFVGVGLVGKQNVEYLPNPAPWNDFAFEQNSTGDTTFFGGGVGYAWNNWLRFEGTAEYRGKTQVNAFGSYTFGGGTFGDAYQGYIKSSIFLANAYVDLGTWWCLTPFVGAGIGGAYNTLADFTDIGIGTSGRGIGRNSSEWHMAYALYAGLAYNVSQNFKVDFTYRYLNYGSVTDTVDCLGNPTCHFDSYKFGNLYSHDFMIGLRWTCCDVDQPRYVYTPPSPLHSRG
jgi:opacity protein-like surface antigen